MSRELTMVLDLVVRATLLVGAGLLAGLCLRRQSASVRHLTWSASLGGALALAALAPWAPRLDIPLRGWHASTPSRVTSVAASAGEAMVVDRPPPIEPGAHSTTITAAGDATRFDGLSPLLVAWSTGALLVLAWGLLGRLGLARLARRATEITDGPWRTTVDAAATAMQVHRPIRILVTPMVGAPVTWGIRRPVLVLPTVSDAWTAAIRQSVVSHEVAHIARRDYLHQVVGFVACAVYWFHPLVWAAAKRMRQAAERACDDLVLAHGTSGEDYAAHLIGVARGSRSLRLAGAMAIGMARPSTLEGRIVAVLDEQCRRGEPSRRGRSVVGVVAIGALVLFGALSPMAAATPGIPTLDSAVVSTNVPLPVVAPPPPRVERTVSTPSAPTTDVQQQRQLWEKEVPASPGGLLELDLRTGGAVDIRGWDEDRVVVRTRLGGDNWRDTEVTIDRQANGVLVKAEYARRLNSYSSHNEFDIRVPRRYDVRIASAGGTLTMTDVDGRFTGHTGGGGFVLENVKGSASLTTGGGEVRVSDSDLSGSVSTGGGPVRLSRVSGGLRGSSGSGPVIYGGAGTRGSGASGDLSGVEVGRDGETITVGRGSRTRVGVLTVSKAGGAIDLDAAPDGARVRTGGGDVRVGSSNGDVQASTGGGDVTVGPARASVRAGTGAGEVHVVVDGSSSDQLIEATSGSGRVIIELPRDWQGALDLETAHTRSHERTARIKSDWDVDEEPLTDWDDREGTPRRYLRATGRIGRGTARVVVRTVNGEIEIRRR